MRGNPGNLLMWFGITLMVLALLTSSGCTIGGPMQPPQRQYHWRWKDHMFDEWYPGQEHRRAWPT